MLGKGEEEVNRYWLIVERSDILAIGGINGYSLMVIRQLLFVIGVLEFWRSVKRSEIPLLRESVGVLLVMFYIHGIILWKINFRNKLIND